MIAAWILAFVLVVVLPWRAVVYSRGGKPVRGRAPRYLQTIVEITALLGWLLLIVRLQGIDWAVLGLAWPPPFEGHVGFVVAATLAIGFLGAVLYAEPNSGSAREQELVAELPESRDEVLAYLALTPFFVFGREILYRGFLLWWLTPLVGMVGAVVIASFAYGLSNGWKSQRRGLGSMLSAFLFTIGYAVTGSLWWLIVIHLALRLIGLLVCWRARTAQAETQQI